MAVAVDGVAGNGVNFTVPTGSTVHYYYDANGIASTISWFLGSSPIHEFKADVANASNSDS